VALAECQVDRVVFNLAADQPLNSPRHTAHAVVDVGEVQHFLLAVDGDGFPVTNFADEQGDDTLHAFEIVVVTAVYVAKAKYQVAQPITLRIAINQRLARNFAGRVRAFREGKIGVAFFGDVTVDVAVHLARAAEDDGQVV